MSVDSIIFPDLRICQPDKGFRFGIDSVVLAWFATVKKNDSIIDIGSGSGVISALLSRLKNAANIDAIELQSEMYACLTETVRMNSLESTITAVNTDINEYKPDKKYNLAVCNPPYRPPGSGKQSQNNVEEIARFTQTLTLDDILRFCKRNLNYGGRLAFTGDADLLVDAICSCRANNFEPKRLMFLQADISKRPKIFFIECVYGAGIELIVEPPVVQIDDGGIYTKILRGKWM